MPLVAALPAIGALAGAGASIYGAVNNGNAVSAAAKVQQDAAQQAQANLSPWMSAGQSALGQEMQLLGLGGGGGAGGTFGAPNWTAYVQNNPDVLAAYQAGNGKGATEAQFGQWHWQNFGQNEVNSGDPNRVYTPYGPAGQSGAAAGGPGATSAISALQNSPLYQALYHNGQQSILANAAATGGLRSGNTNTSLYNLGTQTLGQVYQQQIANLSDLSKLGQNAAAGVGNAGLLGSQFAAGGITSGATANQQLAQSIAGLPAVFGNQQVLNALGLGGGIGVQGINNASPQTQADLAGLF